MGTRTGDGGFVSWQELGSDAIAQRAMEWFMSMKRKLCIRRTLQ